MPLERLVEMNGINYNTLLNNTGLYSNRSTGNDVVQQYANAVNAKTQQAADNKQANADKDTYEHGTVNAKAGYERPKSTGKYKALDSNGVQEGIKLSDNAKNLLEELRKKYGNMSISVAEWSTDEEQDYYAGLTDKDYSVLINPELLEKMAADDSVREQYESVLSNVGKDAETLKTELGEDADKIKGFSITMDADGKVTYAVKLLKDMAEQGKSTAKTQKERIEEQRAARREQEKKKEEKLETEKIEANSIEDLIAAIKEKLHPTQTDEKITIKEEDIVNNGVNAAANVTAE